MYISYMTLRDVLDLAKATFRQTCLIEYTAEYTTFTVFFEIHLMYSIYSEL